MMIIQLQKSHRDVMAVLASSDAAGMSLSGLAKALKTYTPFKTSTILRELEKAELAEMRREGEPWPGEHRAPEAVKPRTPQRLFRLTAAGKKALEG